MHTLRRFIALLAFLFAASSVFALDEPVDEKSGSSQNEPAEERAEKPPAKAQTIITLIEAGEGPRRELRYGVAAGAQQRVLVTTRATMEQLVFGMRTPPTHVPEVRVTVLSTVRKADEDGNFELLLIFADAEIVDEDDAPASPPARRAVRTLKGQRAELALTNRGIVRSMSFDGPPMNAGAVIMGDAVEMFRQALREAMVLLPQEPVGVGARWSVDSVMRTGDFESKRRVEYRITSMHGETIELAVETTEAAKDQPLTMGGSQQMTLRSLEAKGKGEWKISLDRLLPIKASRNVTAEMEIGVGPEGVHTLLQNVKSSKKVEPAPRHDPARDENAVEPR